MTGYLQHIEENQQKSHSLNIPDEIIIEVLKYYFVFISLKFMNGVNILSRDWKKLYKGEIIEYDSDGENEFKNSESGTHIHSGKLINISLGTAKSHKIMIKDETGAYANYSLGFINIKLEDDGTRIYSFQDRKWAYQKYGLCDWNLLSDSWGKF